MKSEFLLAITQLAAEKNLTRDVVLGAVEEALVSAYRKNSFALNQEISVKIDTDTGKVRVWAHKTVVEKPADPRCEISLEEARQIKADAELEDVIEVESTPKNAGRIAAQTAKQVILQRLHEAEHSAILGEYAGKEGDVITGLVRRIEPKQIFIDLGRTEALLPSTEQVPNEKYRIGQRIRVYLLEVARTTRGSRVVVSRSHPDMLRRLLELEVPEIASGVVEIKAVTREAGFRSKVAVVATQEGVDPVGCCVGLRGIRIQNIVSELNREKIDVVSWSEDIETFITNALSPAQVLKVKLGKESATVIVPDRQLSLAIGKEGQNVRLAAKLTGWRIDIKGATDAEEQGLLEPEKKAKPAAAEPEEAAVSEAAPPAEEVAVAEEVVEAKAKVPLAKAEIRFAEDIMAPPSVKPVVKSRKKKKAGRKKTSAVDGIKIKRVRQDRDLEGDEESIESIGAIEDIEALEKMDEIDEIDTVGVVGEVQAAEEPEEPEEPEKPEKPDKADKPKKTKKAAKAGKAEKPEKPKKAKKVAKADKAEKIEKPDKPKKATKTKKVKKAKKAEDIEETE